MANDTEFLVAATSLLPFLEGHPKPLSADDAELAARIPTLIRKSIRHYIDGEDLVVHQVPDFDYDQLLDGLTKTHGVDEIEKLIEGLPEDSELRVSYASDVQRVVAYLQGALPINTRDSLSGTVNHRPNSLDLSRFRRAWLVAESPLVVLNHLNDGKLQDDEVAAVKAMYPTTYQLVLKEVTEAIIDRKAERKGFRLTRKQEAALGTLLQRDQDPGLTQAVQAVFTQAQQQKQAAPRKASDAAADDIETTVQRRSK